MLSCPSSVSETLLASHDCRGRTREQSGDSGATAMGGQLLLARGPAIPQPDPMTMPLAPCCPSLPLPLLLLLVLFLLFSKAATTLHSMCTCCLSAALDCEGYSSSEPG